MSSLWNTLEDATAPTIDSLMHESVRVTPMKSGAYSATPDPDRDEFEAEFGIVLQAASFGDQNLAGHSGTSWNAKLGAMDIEAHVNLSTTPEAASIDDGDIVTLLDRNSDQYRISRIDRGQRNRLIVVLTAL